VEYLDNLKYKISAYENYYTDKKFLLGSLIAVALITRLYLSFRYALWNDEAITANAAISLKNTGAPTFASGFEYWRSIPYTFAVALSAFFLGTSELALRAPSIIFSIASILLTYRLADRIYSSGTGIIASAILTFSLWHIAWSTQVRAYIMFQLLYVGSILLIYRLGEIKRPQNLALLLIISIVASFTHRIGYIIPVVFLGYFCFYYLSENEIRKFAGVIISVLIFIPLFFIATPSNLGDLIAQLAFQEDNLGLYYSLILSNMPLLLILSGAGILASIRENLRATFLLFISVVPASMIIILFVDGVASRYLFFSLPILAIWTGLSVQKISCKISEKIRAEWCSQRNLVVLITVFIVSFGFLSSSINDFRPNSPDRGLYDHLNQNALEEDIIITQWTPVMAYYHRPPDYTLYADENSMFSNLMKDHNYSGREVYAGAKFIDDADTFEHVVENNSRGWLVLRDNSYRRKRPEIKNIIAELEEVGDYRGWRMWKWNSSTINESRGNQIQ